MPAVRATVAPIAVTPAAIPANFLLRATRNLFSLSPSPVGRSVCHGCAPFGGNSASPGGAPSSASLRISRYVDLPMPMRAGEAILERRTATSTARGRRRVPCRRETMDVAAPATLVPRRRSAAARWGTTAGTPPKPVPSRGGPARSAAGCGQARLAGGHPRRRRHRCAGCRAHRRACSRGRSRAHRAVGQHGARVRPRRRGGRQARSRVVSARRRRDHLRHHRRGQRSADLRRSGPRARRSG